MLPVVLPLAVASAICAPLGAQQQQPQDSAAWTAVYSSPRSRQQAAAASQPTTASRVGQPAAASAPAVAPAPAPTIQPAAPSQSQTGRAASAWTNGATGTVGSRPAPATSGGSTWSGVYQAQAPAAAPAPPAAPAAIQPNVIYSNNGTVTPLPHVTTPSAPSYPSNSRWAPVYSAPAPASAPTEAPAPAAPAAPQAYAPPAYAPPAAYAPAPAYVPPASAAPTYTAPTAPAYTPQVAPAPSYAPPAYAAASAPPGAAPAATYAPEPTYAPAPAAAPSADQAASYAAPPDQPAPPSYPAADVVSDEPSVTPSSAPATYPYPGAYPTGPAAPVAGPATRAARRRAAADTVPPSGPGRSSVRLDELMSLHEWETSGVSRLRPGEVAVLEKFIERYRQQIADSVTRTFTSGAARGDVRATMPPISRSSDGTPKNARAVVGVKAAGHYVTLDDNSVWDIYSADQTESANWQAGDLIQVRQSPVAYGDYDHDLVNTKRTGPVRAKFMGYARPDAPQ
jgi:hypothetical protein